MLHRSRQHAMGIMRIDSVKTFKLILTLRKTLKINVVPIKVINKCKDYWSTNHKKIAYYFRFSTSKS